MIIASGLEVIAQVSSGVRLIVLGNVQDAGSPHMACAKACCIDLFNNPDPERKVSSLGIIDDTEEQIFVFDASPDFTSQSKYLKEKAEFDHPETPDGIFLTHAHIGHYTGLMYLGREAMNANKVPVYAMPRMKNFLETNGPWGQLNRIRNIEIRKLTDDSIINLTASIRVTPFRVPHRDEYSETVGFKIEGPQKTAIFIPDIDKWSKWKTSIVNLIKEVDYAFLDGTFYDENEINNRDISEIPHPFVIESMELFTEMPKIEKRKIHFIHFNHTNPLLNRNSPESDDVEEKGYGIARMGDEFGL